MSEVLSSNSETQDTPSLKMSYRILCSDGQGSDFSLKNAANNVSNKLEELKEDESKISRLINQIEIQRDRDDLSDNTKATLLELQKKLSGLKQESSEIGFTLENNEFEASNNNKTLVTNKKFNKRFHGQTELLKRAKKWINGGEPNFYLEVRDGKMTNIRCASDSWGGQKTDYWKGGLTEMHNVAKEFEGQAISNKALRKLADQMEDAYRKEFQTQKERDIDTAQKVVSGMGEEMTIHISSIATTDTYVQRFNDSPDVLKAAKKWINGGEPNFYLEVRDGKMTNIRCASDSWGGQKTDYWKGGLTEMHNVAKEFESKEVTSESMQKLADRMENAYKIEFAN